MSIGFVCLMGMGTVFVGLICIIVLCKITSAIIRSAEKNGESAASAAEASEPVGNRQQMIAAVCAALAEELGTDVSALRVLSFKKL